MAIVVEDGTGKPDAESYASVAEFKAHADKLGHDYAGKSDDDIEKALRRATIWLDATYGAIYLGCPLTVTQALEWPRVGVEYRCVILPAAPLPAGLIAATSEAAYREVTEPGSLSQDVSAVAIKRDRVGDAETEFFASSRAASYPSIDANLRGLTKGKASGYIGRAVRG